ncbi:hypothetical protein JCM10449v2_006743 [Rhodotorula kratochvilovae]
MSSLLRRLRSTSKLHPRSDIHTSSAAAAAAAPPPSPRLQLGFSPPPSPGKLRAAPPRRGYATLDGGEGGPALEEVPDERDIVCWTLDEGDGGGELDAWEWVDYARESATHKETRRPDADALDEFRFPRPAPSPPRSSAPLLQLPVSPPTVPVRLPSDEHPSRLTPTKRKASFPSPSASSPTSSLSSTALPPLSPSGTSLTSLSTAPSSGTSTVSSISLSLTIATRLDSNGHRVLTSRRRQSLQPSPHKARRNRGAFGIGDEASDVEREDGEEDARLEKVDAAGEEAGARAHLEPMGAAGLGLIDLGAFVHEPESMLAPARRPPRAPLQPLQPLQPLALDPSALAYKHKPVFVPPSPRRLTSSEHQPIKTFTPPPPLYPPSPTKSSAFATLTRSNTTYSMSSAPGSPSKRRHSLQPRKSFRRLSLSRASVSYGPPMTATFSPAHDRRASAPVLPPLSGLDRHASLSSCGGGGLSVPPTPGATSASSHFSLGTTTSEPLLLLGRQSSAGAGGAAYARRASQVSFELPPSSPSEARRAAASDEGHATAAMQGGPPLSPSSSFGRSGERRHARAKSDGAARALPLQASVVERGWAAMDETAERELARGRLFVANPDQTPTLPPASTPLSSPPDTPIPPRIARMTPIRPPKSLARRSAPPSSWVPPPPPPLSHQIGIAG